MELARTQRGFTIVEVLIVLAVTSAMFILAAGAINGKQDETEFQQSINNITSSIQQTINQISAGEYPNVNDFTCDGTTGILKITPGTNQQGANNGCILLGEAMQFGFKGTSPQQYRTYIIAGLQHDSSGDDITSLTAAKPAAIAPGTATNDKGVPDASVPGYLQDGLTAVWMKSNGKPVAAVAFISSLGQYKGGNLVSGSQQLSVYPVASSSGNDQVPNSQSPYVAEAINKNLASAPQNPSSGVQICFASGGTNQSGLVTIGSGSRSLTVTTQIKDGNTICK